MTRVEAVTAPSAVQGRALAVGAIAGLLSGLFGIGGGIVIVPSLIALLAMDRRVAHGTSLAATLPVAAASLVTYATNANVDWPIAACLAVGAICGAIVGTHLLRIIPKRPLTMIFIATILLAAIRLVLASDPAGRDKLSLAMAIALIAVGFVTGTLSGLLGIGGGVVMVPVMVVLFSMPPVLAKGTSVAVIVPSSLTGTLRNRVNRNTNLRVGAAVGGAGVVTAVIGSMISDSIPDQFSNTMFALLLVIVAALQIRSLRRPSNERLPPIEP